MIKNENISKRPIAQNKPTETTKSRGTDTEIYYVGNARLELVVCDGYIFVGYLKSNPKIGVTNFFEILSFLYNKAVEHNVKFLKCDFANKKLQIFLEKVGFEAENLAPSDNPYEDYEHHILQIDKLKEFLEQRGVIKT